MAGRRLSCKASISSSMLGRTRTCDLLIRSQPRPISLDRPTVIYCLFAGISYRLSNNRYTQRAVDLRLVVVSVVLRIKPRLLLPHLRPEPR
jgi:hypothetical protein